MVTTLGRPHVSVIFKEIKDLSFWFSPPLPCSVFLAPEDKPTGSSLGLNERPPNGSLDYEKSLFLLREEHANACQSCLPQGYARHVGRKRFLFISPPVAAYMYSCNRQLLDSSMCSSGFTISDQNKRLQVAYTRAYAYMWVPHGSL